MWRNDFGVLEDPQLQISDSSRGHGSHPGPLPVGRRRWRGGHGGRYRSRGSRGHPSLGDGESAGLEITFPWGKPWVFHGFSWFFHGFSMVFQVFEIVDLLTGPFQAVESCLTHCGCMVRDICPTARERERSVFIFRYMIWIRLDWLTWVRCLSNRIRDQTWPNNMSFDHRHTAPVA